MDAGGDVQRGGGVQRDGGDDLPACGVGRNREAACAAAGDGDLRLCAFEAEILKPGGRAVAHVRNVLVAVLLAVLARLREVRLLRSVCR